MKHLALNSAVQTTHPFVVQSLAEKLVGVEAALKESRAEGTTHKKNLCRLQMERDEARSLMTKLKVRFRVVRLGFSNFRDQAQGDV